jgi:hypothetical protein
MDSLLKPRHAATTPAIEAPRSDPRNTIHDDDVEMATGLPGWDLVPPPDMVARRKPLTEPV